MAQNLRYKFRVSIMALLLGGILISQKVNAIEPGSMERLGGATNVETAIEIALRLNPGMAPAVILARPTSYFNALAGIPLAQQKEAPILWVGKNPQSSKAVFDFIEEHCDKNGLIYILGDEDIISRSFETELDKLGYRPDQIERLGGGNHYETAIEIAQLVEYKGNPVIIMSGEDDSQIAGAAAMAAAKDSPNLFVSSEDKTWNRVIDYLNSIPTEEKLSIQIFGDTKAIPETFVAELKAKVKNLEADSVKRISGKSPYKLMAKVNQEYWLNASQEENKKPISRITLTTGRDYADGIVGAVLAARNKAPLIFIDPTMPKDSVNLLKGIYKWNKQTTESFRQMTVLGGEKALPPLAVTEAEGLFTLGQSLKGNAQVWNYAGLEVSSVPCYGVIGEDNSVIVSDPYYNTLYQANKELGNITLTNSGHVLDEYGKPNGEYKDGFATEAMFDSPKGITKDQDGVIYIADTGNGAIRTIDQYRNVKTLVKGLNHPTGIVINSKGEIFVTETLNHRILKVDSLGNWTVFAGGGYFLKDGELEGDLADGKGEQAKFNEPQGLAIDSEDNLYVADSANQRIRKVSTEGIVTTIAGSGMERIENTTYLKGGYQDGDGKSAKFNFPLGLAVGPDYTIYVADTYNHCIRMITQKGVVRTLAGGREPGNRNGIAALARFHTPTDVLLLEDGRIIIVDQGNALLRVYHLPEIPRQRGYFMTKAKYSARISLATLENIDGGVYVKKGGGMKEIKGIRGMDIAQGDSVRTDQEGAANLVFRTGSTMTVGPNTSFTMDKLSETKASGGKISIKLKSGTLWNSVKSLINSEDEYEIVTSSSGAEVKGTLFMVSIDPNTGGQTTSVFEGSIRADSADASRNHGSLSQYYLLHMGQSGTVLPPQRTPGSSIYNPQFPASPPPPPPPQPIDTQSLVQNQAPSILASMAMDMVDRMQEMQRQNEALMASYQNTNNPAYLQSALQQSQANSLLGSLNQQYISAVQGSPQEQQMNQFLQQQNRNMDSLRQQAQQLQEQAQQMRNNTENAAQQAGLSPDQIQRLYTNATTASASAGAYPTAPPPIAPPPPLSYVPSTPPTSNGGGSNSGYVPFNPVVPILDLSVAGVSGSAITVVWSTSQKPEHVTLQSSYDGQNWSNYSGNYTVAVTGSAITVNDLNPNTEYYFRIVVVEGINRRVSNRISLITDKLKLAGISDITGTARVGETLSAGILIPANATVTYQWQIADIIDGAYETIEGGIGSQYTISANDLNKFIRLVVTGTGDYTGTVINNPTDAVAEPIPISWSLPKPTLSFNTEGDTSYIVIDYTANQRGTFYYMITRESFMVEDDQELIDFMTFDWEGNDQILLRGSEECSLDVLERLEIAYSEMMYSNMEYKLYVVLKGIYNTYSEVERITFSTPKDEKSPVLTASVVYTEDTAGLNMNHFVKDYDEFYDLYVWVIPKDYPLNGEPTAQEVKDAGRAYQGEYPNRLSRKDNLDMITIPDVQPGTEYIIYLVVQDHSEVGEGGEGLFSEVKKFSVTTPIPSTT